MAPPVDVPVRADRRTAVPWQQPLPIETEPPMSSTQSQAKRPAASAGLRGAISRPVRELQARASGKAMPLRPASCRLADS
jgi:hypothetical protein